jgi:hypothetical protein
MSFLWSITYLIGILVLLLPFVVAAALRFLLRNFSFKTGVGGPLTLSGIMFRIPIKMNLQALIQVESVSLKLQLPPNILEFIQQPKPFRFLKIVVSGLQVNLLLKDDFKKWSSSKIELLSMIDEMRQKMKRLGLLSPKQSVPLEPVVVDSEFPTIKKFSEHFQIEAIDTSINFYVYSMEDIRPVQLKDCDTMNIREFCRECLSDEKFKSKYLTSRIFIPKCEGKMLRMMESYCEIQLTAGTVLL